MMIDRIRAGITFPNVVSLLALFVAIGAGTYAAAAIPGKDARITGCYEKRGGDLRLIDGEKRRAKCAKGEKKIVWNQQGPTGPGGQQGQQGPVGPAGSPDTPNDVLAKLKGVDGTGSGLDSDTLGGTNADGFVRSRRILYGRDAAAANAVLLSWPAMGLEVRTSDPVAGDSAYQVRIRNANPPGGTRLYVTVGSTVVPLAPGASSAFGGLGGVPNALVVENGGAGRLARLSCFANVLAAGDDNFVQCMAVTAGPGS